VKKPWIYLACVLLLCTTLVACPPIQIQALAVIQVKNGDAQTAVVGTELPAAISVHAADGTGAPMAGQIVNFKVTQGGGSVFAGSAITDANGNASERWTLGTLAGVQKVEVRAVNSAGVAIVFATIQATAIAGAPSSIVNDSGDGQFAERGRTLASPIAVVVTDQFGNPTAGVELSFAAQNGGSASPSTALTDLEGKTSTAWTLGVAQLGLQSMKVFVSAAPSVQFNVSATAIETIPFAITIVGGNQQTVTQHVPLLEPLQVRVTDYLGNPKPDVYVEFYSSPGYGFIQYFSPVYGYLEGVGNVTTLITNANGIAEWNGTFHSSGGQRVTVRAVAFTNGPPLPNIAPVEFSFNVISAGLPFDGLFEITTIENNTQIIKFQVLSRNGKALPVISGLGDYISGLIDSVIGMADMNVRSGLTSGVLHDHYTGNFSVSSDGTVTGSGSVKLFIGDGNPTARIGTWTAIKIHD
jgi:hypothetical protein